MNASLVKQKARTIRAFLRIDVSRANLGGVKMKLSNVLCGFLLILAVAMNAQAQEVSAEQEWQIKAEIKELADNYGYYLDHSMVDEYLSIWSEDAIAVDGDRRWQGHDEMRTRVRAPSSTRLAMHVMGTSHIDIIDANHATGVHYATIYAAALEGPREQSEIISMEGIYLVAKYMDEYLLTEDGWKISYRDIDRVFTSLD